jgi:uncharacterized protein
MSNLSLSGYPFAGVERGDYRKLADFFQRYPQPLTGFTVASLVAWRPFFHYEWTIVDAETLLISYILDTVPRAHLLQPIGEFPPRVKQKIVETASQLTYPLKVVGVCERFLKENLDFIRQFTVHEDRASSNYLYKARDLARLSGRKYSKKRNLLSQARNQYEWNTTPLTPKLAGKCLQVLDSIAEEEQPGSEAMEVEHAALQGTLRNFEELKQQGLLISVDDRPIAFSIFEPISPDTVAIHFERALRSYKGLYQVVNWEAAKVIEAQGFGFINREEDLGDPGLRDAKMSYHPVKIIPSFELIYKHPAPGGQEEEKVETIFQ